MRGHKTIRIQGEAGFDGGYVAVCGLLGGLGVSKDPLNGTD